MRRPPRGGGSIALARERLFLAVPLPKALLPTVRRAQAQLADIQGVRLLAKDQLHVTVAFVGEVELSEQESVEEVAKELGQEPGGEVMMGQSMLFFPKPARPRVVALSLEDQADTLLNLHEKAVVGLKLRGVHVEADRRYHPHLTIARLKKTGSIGRKLEGEPMLFPVRSLCLYRSDLTFGGAEHTELMTVDLAAAGSE